jgi:4'-phosphopantetheinyl transferase EntD
MKQRAQSTIAWHLPRWLVHWVVVRAAIQTDSSLGADGLPVWPTLMVGTLVGRLDKGIR